MNQVSPSSNSNPYAAPDAAQVTAGNEEYQDVKIFSTKGRIGRVRYIGYSIAISFLISMVFGALSAIAGSPALIALAYIIILPMTLILTIQRCHDFNASGWWAITVFIPFVALIFWILPGTDGENRFGNKTRPNSTGAVILAVIIPLIAIVGILAAIAIPAYQDYVNRAKAAQSR